MKEYQNFADVLGSIASSLFNGVIDADTPDVVLGGLRVTPSLTSRILTIEGGSGSIIQRFL